jgi:chromate transporter
VRHHAPRAEIADLARLFFRLGATAFGGPAAHVAMMRHEVVQRKRWLPDQEFLDLLGATNLIPGPNSTELAIHIGHARAGWLGLLVAGVAFIAPATIIVTVLAWAYVTHGARPEATGILYGVKPAIVAVVLQAIYGLQRTAVKSVSLAVLTGVAVVLAALGVHELLILLGAGSVWMLWRSVGGWAALVPMGWLAVPAAAAATAAKPFGIWGLFWFFAKVGSVLFGSGYVLLAFLRADLVERWGWISESVLLDAIAVGQVTPGPVFTTATFIGFVLGGGTGALAATLGIFLPAFFFVAISGPLIPRLRRSAQAAAFLDAVNCASLALMAVVTWQLARSAIVDVTTLLIAIASAAVLLRYRINSAWLVLGGAAVGLMASWL